MNSRAQIRTELRDTEWPLDYIDHDREIVRAIVVDEAGMYYFVRAVRDDEFGASTLIETSGGGVEPGEDPGEAIGRELREELGVDAAILCKIGVVSDYYNLIHRHNINHYYLCRIRSFGDRRLTRDEMEKYHLSTLKLSYEEALAEYEKRSDTRLGRLIAKREMPILRRAKRLLEERRNTKVWCFGDSNTYGYDPRGFSGGRYAARWPELMARETGFQVVNDGKNGRTIPCGERELLQLRRDAAGFGADVIVVMLGANDLLNGASAEAATARMEVFLTQCSAPHALLIGPPPMRRGAWVPEDRLVAESAKLSGQYRILAERAGIRFADAAGWNVDLAYDGVHFSEEGHARFARGIARVLNDLFNQESEAAGRAAP